MGHKSSPELPPQYFRHLRESTDKVRRKAPLPPGIFGIQRPVGSDLATRLSLQLDQLLAQNERLAPFKVKKQPVIPIIPLEMLAKQARQGSLTKQPGSIRNKIEQKVHSTAQLEPDVEIGGIHLRWGVLLFLDVQSDVLAEEAAIIRDTAQKNGVRDMDTLRRRQLGIYLGSCPKLMTWSDREELKLAALQAFDTVHGVENELTVGRLDVYGADERLAA